MPDPALLQALDAERAAFLDALERVPAEDRARRPAPEAWSVLDIAEHLYLTEAGLTRLITKWIERGRPPSLDAPDGRRLDRLVASLDGARRYEVPEDSIRPTGALDYVALREAWRRTGGAWHHLAAALPGTWADAPLMRHASAGPLAWDGILRFLAAHLHHHRGQLERTVAALA